MFFTTLALFLKSPFGSLLTLDDSIEQKGTKDRSALLNTEGEAVTDLRPGGRAVFDGHRVDVTAQTGYVACGSHIRVIKVQGNQITVKEIQPT